MGRRFSETNRMNNAKIDPMMAIKTALRLHPRLAEKRPGSQKRQGLPTKMLAEKPEEGIRVATALAYGKTAKAPRVVPPSHKEEGRGRSRLPG